MWELVRNVESQAPPLTDWIEIFTWTRFRWFDRTFKFEKHWCRTFSLSLVYLVEVPCKTTQGWCFVSHSYCCWCREFFTYSISLMIIGSLWFLIFFWVSFSKFFFFLRKLHFTYGSSCIYKKMFILISWF